MTSSNLNIFCVTDICARNSPVTGEFPSRRPVTRSFGVIIDLRLNERLSKKSWGWWFGTPPGSLWRHCNALIMERSFVFRTANNKESLGVFSWWLPQTWKCCVPFVYVPFTSMWLWGIYTAMGNREKRKPHRWLAAKKVEPSWCCAHRQLRASLRQVPNWYRKCKYLIHRSPLS